MVGMNGMIVDRTPKIRRVWTKRILKTTTAEVEMETQTVSVRNIDAQKEIGNPLGNAVITAVDLVAVIAQVVTNIMPSRKTKKRKKRHKYQAQKSFLQCQPRKVQKSTQLT
jgi:hypothetical protein